MTDYIFTLNENTFDLATDEIIIRVVGYDVNITVNSLKDAIITVKSLASEGIMSRVKIERLHYVKSVHAMNQDGKWLVQYYPVWKEYPVINYRLEFGL